MGKTGQNRAWEGAGKMPGTLMHVTVAKDLNNVKKQTMRDLEGWPATWREGD